MKRKHLGLIVALVLLGTLALFLYWPFTPRETAFVLPKNHDIKNEVTVVVWLHGYGGSPANKQAEFQVLADQPGLAFIAVSGPYGTGNGNFAWADEPEEDYAQVTPLLAEARRRCRIRGRFVALGFSQGGMVGLEMALRHPDEFAGAITISAGAGPIHVDSVADRTALPRQGFVIVCGAMESLNSVKRSEHLASWLRANNGHVLEPQYPDHSQHTFPVDWREKLPEWLEFIKRADSKSN